MATQANIPLTEEEYLRRERAAEFKSEFHNGWVYAMSGGSANHSLLAGAILALLRPQLRPGCRVFSSDLRVKIPVANLYTYPDCQVICGDPAITEGDNALNPLLLAEVLSPSTEAYDRGKKFELYRTIPSFREYLLIHQDRLHVEHYSRQEDGSWVLREYSGRETTLEIARLDAHISMADLYDGAINVSE
jgi:Uma2 family endonuclease